MNEKKSLIKKADIILVIALLLLAVFSYFFIELIEKITDMSKECNGWGISLEYYSEVINGMPWYIKEPFERGKIYFNEALHKLEEDDTEKGTG